jgi:cytochrome bd ubiquinol oxidase subunit I
LDALTLHRIHFGFTITYHYLFPQLTMGLALLIVILKTVALRTTDPDKQAKYDVAARFWGKIFAINFLLGVVTGIPMEFQFGTNWSEFSRRTGGVFGMPLAMEGIFSFFLESAFLGLFPLALCSARFHRLVDLGLLHHRHQRLDAAPRRLQAPS